MMKIKDDSKKKKRELKRINTLLRQCNGQEEIFQRFPKPIYADDRDTPRR